MGDFIPNVYSISRLLIIPGLIMAHGLEMVRSYGLIPGSVFRMRARPPYWTSRPPAKCRRPRACRRRGPRLGGVHCLDRLRGGATMEESDQLGVVEMVGSKRTVKIGRK